jgi:hypothetical protein
LEQAYMEEKEGMKEGRAERKKKKDKHHVNKT